MCNRCPSKANNSVVASLDEAGTAQLQQATELAQLYSLNKCTPDIWQTIINCVEAEGSLSGMLRKLTVPLMHSGYQLAKCKAACDWQYQHMSAAEADDHLQQLRDSIHSSNAALYGADRLPVKPACPVLLQSVVCLLTADWDSIKSSFASPAARSEAVLATAAAAAASAVHAAAETARHVAAGNAAAADASANLANSAAAAARNNTRLALALAQEAAAVTPPAWMAAGPATGPAELTAVATGLAGPAAASTELADTVGRAGPARSTEPAASLELAAGVLAQAAATASPGPAGAITLRRGAGLLLLVPSSKLWHQLPKPLGGSISFHSTSYSRYTIGQLMTPAGLLLQGGQQQCVQVRVAAEFVAGSRPLSGNWAKQPCDVDVWPGQTLLLWEQPSHKLGRKFGGDAASYAYPALYSTFADQRITAAVGGRA
jgi:hypothetical protein